MPPRARLIGYNGALRKAKTLEDLIPLMVAKALHREGKRIMALSQERVPRDTGRLAASSYVKPPEFIGPIAQVELGYDAPYATYIHEHPRAGETEGLRPGIRGSKGHGYSSWAGTGQWKYLEVPANEMMITSKNRIAADVAVMLAQLKAGIK